MVPQHPEGANGETSRYEDTGSKLQNQVETPRH